MKKIILFIFKKIVKMLRIKTEDWIEATIDARGIYDYTQIAKVMHDMIKSVNDKQKKNWANPVNTKVLLAMLKRNFWRFWA